MALGLIHLNTGLAISFIKKIKHGQIADAIWEEGSLWVTLAGIILYVLKIGNVSGVPVVLIIGALSYLPALALGPIAEFTQMIGIG